MDFDAVFPLSCFDKVGKLNFFEAIFQASQTKKRIKLFYSLFLMYKDLTWFIFVFDQSNTSLHFAKVSILR